MKSTISNKEAFEKAKKRAEAKLGFYTHLSVFIVVMILLLFINLNTPTGYLWVKWPLLGWGIAIVFHALGVFVSPNNSTLSERMIEKELEKEGFKKEESEDHFV